jgi:hypothetical protein
VRNEPGNECTTESTTIGIVEAEMFAGCMRQHLTDQQLHELMQHMRTDAKPAT